MANELGQITTELVKEVLAELEELEPAVEELAERARAALWGVTRDEDADETPAAAERLHGLMVRLSRSFGAVDKPV